MSHEEQRRSYDPALIKLGTLFDAFLERYERDVKASQVWREDTTVRLRIHCDFIKKVSPIYQRLCWVLGVATISAVGVGVTAFLKHLQWR